MSNRHFESQLRSLYSHASSIATNLLSVGVTSFDGLIGVVQDASIDAATRTLAAGALGLGAKLWDKDEAINALTSALEDQSIGVRIAVCNSLGIIGDDRAVEPLLQVLDHDSESSVKIAAIQALRTLGDERARRPLIRVLEDKDIEGAIRGVAAEALVRFADTESFLALVKALNDESVEVRYDASFALGEMGNKEAIPYLRDLADSDDAVFEPYGSVHQEALDALRKLEVASTGKH
jgi:HEAT repeat protein